MEALDRPKLPDVGVLALVPDDWSPIWLTRHHVVSRLTEYFHVVWVNRAPEWRQALRQLGRPGAARPPARNEVGTLRLYDAPPWLPGLHRPAWLAGALNRQRLRDARRVLIDRGCRKTILYMWRPEFEPLVRGNGFDLTCYHMEDEYAFTEVEQPIEEREERLIAAVDQVIVGSKGLFEKKGSINPNTVFVPSGGVDYAAYAARRPEPADLAGVPRPRIGYAGFIKRQLNWPLLLELARRHPEWHFVYVGPRSPHPEIAGILSELGSRSNVHFLGAKSAEEVIPYPQHFDVCMMPYRLTAYQQYVYPLKLPEYLATGRPTVATPIRSLEDFANVVALASTADEWSAAIRSALAPAANTADARLARQAVARRHDWGVLIGQIAMIMAQRLGERFADRLAESLDSRPRVPMRDREGRPSPPLEPVARGRREVRDNPPM